MSEILEQPFDAIERAEFIEQYQGNDGYRIEILKDENNSEFKIFALKPNEYIENGIAKINENYENYIAKLNLQLEVQELNERIKELDLKRIRAICEPSVKDESTAETWLQYYNTQIQALRSQIQALQERINEYDITE
ncbi:hypothetical protein IKQ21_09460 [bacterium]|nr:hypothetical protein [bacterium]